MQISRVRPSLWHVHLELASQPDWINQIAAPSPQSNVKNVQLECGISSHSVVPVRDVTRQFGDLSLVPIAIASVMVKIQAKLKAPQAGRKIQAGTRDFHGDSWVLVNYLSCEMPWVATLPSPVSLAQCISWTTHFLCGLPWQTQLWSTLCPSFESEKKVFQTIMVLSLSISPSL